MPIDIEQWRAEIGNFNGHSQHSIVNLYLNLSNLLSYIVLMFICIFVLTLSLIIKLQSFWVFAIGFLYAISSLVSVSFLWSNILKLIFPERPSTNYFYVITFIDVLYSTYYLHILLLQNGHIETNPGPTQKLLLLPLEC